MGWRKGELFEQGAVGRGQELIGMLSTRSCSLCPAGRERQRDMGGWILPRSAAEPISVLCRGKASSAEGSLFSLLPAAMALVPVLLQLGERWLGRTAGSCRWWEEHASHWSFSEQ